MKSWNNNYIRSILIVIVILLIAFVVYPNISDNQVNIHNNDSMSGFAYKDKNSSSNSNNSDNNNDINDINDINGGVQVTSTSIDMKPRIVDEDTLELIHLPNINDSIKLYIRHENVIVPSLKREYNILFITDSHVIELDGEEDDQTKAMAESRMTSILVDDNKVRPSSTFKYWIEYANLMEVDIVILGGDIIDYPSAANISMLRRELSNLNMPYYYVLGNHDWTYPWEYMTNVARDNYIPLLSDFLRGDQAGSYYELDDIIILGINNSSNQVEVDALPIVREALKINKTTIVVQHIPLSTKSLISECKKYWDSPVVLGHGIHGGIPPSDTSAEYRDIISATNSPVVAILAGHIHMHYREDISEDITMIVGNAAYKGEATMIHMKSK